MYRITFTFKVLNEYGECHMHGLVSSKLRSSKYLFEFVEKGKVIDSVTDSLDDFVKYWTSHHNSVEFTPITKFSVSHE